MKALLATLFLALAVGGAQAQEPQPAVAQPTFWGSVQAVIERHLGRPYVWGSSGRKSFDCSGFVWRVMTENGILIKRTTARKYYQSLKPTAKGQNYSPANFVFFDDLKHVGIVSDRENFYHAAVTKGTHLASFDPYWRPKIMGFRLMPRPKQE